ncbi:XisI protein [Candidatus Chloroploca sp. M-50]|uniref:XisI protein n=2 Tax=Candidatus Chloroploca mongolica TaxID=2528176 RepID=A0ABS4DGP1_9CHLR|nr:XisI protein [Candidatus Chloroploca mongolica]
MDTVNQYRQLIQAILTEYASYRPHYGDIEMELITDTSRDHYQLLSVGWNNLERIYCPCLPSAL